MTGMDMCGFYVDVECGLPKLTITAATGAFDSAEKKVMLYFIEGIGTDDDHLNVDTLYSDVGMMATQTDAGNFWEIFMNINSQGN
jgi:hypothetical protein